jgi:hypothetical protein
MRSFSLVNLCLIVAWCCINALGERCPQCNGHGTCSINAPLLSICSCEFGWDNAFGCTDCIEGVYGQSCSESSNADSRSTQWTCFAQSLCEKCVVVPGKGWCASQRACMYGNATGPTLGSSCDSSWQFGVCGPCSRGSVSSPPPTGLVHYYKLDGNLVDSVGVSSDGVGEDVSFVVGGVTGQAAFGQWRIPADVSSSAMPQLTIGAWVRVVKPLANTINVTLGVLGRALLIMDNGAVAASVGYEYNSTLPIVSDADWHCVAVTYDESRRVSLVFMDGFTQSVANTATLDGPSFARVTGFAEVDNLFVYNRALASSELLDVCSANSQQQDANGCVTDSRWSFQATVKPPFHDNIDFGRKLSTSGDGNTMILGAARDSPDSAGSAFVYSRNATHSEWVFETRLQSSNIQAQDYFGYAVAIDFTGNTVIVGAVGEGSNAVSVNGNELDNSMPFSGTPCFVFCLCFSLIYKNSIIISKRCCLRFLSRDLGCLVAECLPKELQYRCVRFVWERRFIARRHCHCLFLVRIFKWHIAV